MEKQYQKYIKKNSPGCDALDCTRDISMVIIKPEPLEDGRAQGIMEMLESHCKSNNLAIIAAKEFVLSETDITSHYLAYEGKFETMGKRIINYINESGPEKRALAESMGLTSLPYERLGRMVMEIELKHLVGKKELALFIVGSNALSKISGIRGDSDPISAGKDTIRGRFSSGMGIVDMMIEGRPLDKLVHVPETYEELYNDITQMFGIEPKDILKPLKDIGAREETALIHNLLRNESINDNINNA